MEQRINILQSPQLCPLPIISQTKADPDQCKIQIQEPDDIVSQQNFRYPFYSSGYDDENQMICMNRQPLVKCQCNPFGYYTFPFQHRVMQNYNIPQNQQFHQVASRDENKEYSVKIQQDQKDKEYKMKQLKKKILTSSSKKTHSLFETLSWSSAQNHRYIQYIRKHINKFSLSLKEKKKIRVNVLMSAKIKSRSPQQCHSHHQKMIKKYGSIKKILAAVDNGTFQVRAKTIISDEGQMDNVRKDFVKIEELKDLP